MNGQWWQTKDGKVDKVKNHFSGSGSEFGKSDKKVRACTLVEHPTCYYKMMPKIIFASAFTETVQDWKKSNKKLNPNSNIVKNNNRTKLIRHTTRQLKSLHAFVLFVNDLHIPEREVTFRSIKKSKRVPRRSLFSTRLWWDCNNYCSQYMRIDLPCFIYDKY